MNGKQELNNLQNDDYFQNLESIFLKLCHIDQSGATPGDMAVVGRSPNKKFK